MFDNPLLTLICTNLEAGMAMLGVSIGNVVQQYQPEQQGTPSGPTVFIYKIGPDTLVGQPESDTVTGEGSATFTASISATVMTVTGVTSGELAPYQAITGANVPAGVVITAQLSGTEGGAGTYSLSQFASVGSESMTSQGTVCTLQTTQYATRFQLSALSTQTPNNPNQLTASDILNLAASVLQSKVFIAAIQSQGVGILKVQQVPNPYFSDDRQRYEASPNLDFTVTHLQQVITGVPVVTVDAFDIYPV